MAEVEAKENLIEFDEGRHRRTSENGAVANKMRTSMMMMKTMTTQTKI